MKMQQFILFVGVERSADDLNVTFFNRNGQQRASWRVFKSLGERAMEAVITAGWILYKLEGIAQSVHEGTFDQNELDELKDSAKKRAKLTKTGWLVHGSIHRAVATGRQKQL